MNKVHLEHFLADVVIGPKSVKAEAERLATNVHSGSGDDQSTSGVIGETGVSDFFRAASS